MSTASAELRASWDVGAATSVHSDGVATVYCDATEGLWMSGGLRNYYGKADSYMKLFRIDGAANVERWSELTWRSFFGSDLVVEYLDSM